MAEKTVAAPPVPPPSNVAAVSITTEMQQAYLDYSMSVIIGRALPDVRDGLKPVHRRILYAMYDEGLLHNKRYSKCAGVVGEVLKKYHPHGDASVYDALVRLAQPWNMRYLLVDGQGNFGSVDGDSAAAYRYTESRLMRMAEMMLADIDKDTVDYGPNYDDSRTEPLVLPSRFPNLLVNGSEGIAVGMATKIPPHNLGEVIDATVLLIDKPDASVSDLMTHVQGPDFPTGAFIYGREGIRSIYETGRGSVKMRAKYEIEAEKKSGRESIVVTEIPFQVNKARLIEKIADLIKEKKIEGISDLRDESDRDGMRIVVELKRDANSGIVVNNLFLQTEMETSFSTIMLSIDAGQPKILNLKEMLNRFIGHRRDVVTRRCRYELKKAQDQLHVVEALGIASQHIDTIVDLIRKSADPDSARETLKNTAFSGLSGLLERAFALDEARSKEWPDYVSVQKTAVLDAQNTEPKKKSEKGTYLLSDRQVQAILELRLQRLTGLEREKIEREYAELFYQIAKLKDVLSHDSKLMAVIVSELKEIKQLFADDRRTQIIASAGQMNDLDLIKDEEMIVTVSHTGYVKRNPISLYRAQKRGGKGKIAAAIKDEDFVTQVFVASTHSYLFVFTNKGRLYWLRVHEIPQAGRGARGKAIVNLVQLQPDEKISVIVPVRQLPEYKGKDVEDDGEGGDKRTVVMVTKKGVIKRTALANFSNVRAAGLIALGIEDDDALVAAGISDGTEDVLMSTADGISNRFPIDEVRVMGRGAYGVKAITLEGANTVVSAELCLPNTQPLMLTVTENGYGKRSELVEYRRTHRGSKGVIDIQTNDRNGQVIATLQCQPDEDILIVTDQGTLIRTKTSEIRLVGRNTQGVRLINLAEKEKVVGISKLAAEEKDDAEEGVLDTLEPKSAE